MMKKPTESGKIVKNATWLIACKVVQSLLSFVIGTLSARYLGPGNYGIIDYAAAIVSFMVPVVQLGLRSTLVHEIIAAPDSEGKTLGTSLFMSTATSFLGIFGVIAFTAIANPNDPETMLVCALYSISLVFQATEILQYWFQAKLLSKYIAITSLAAYVVVSAYAQIRKLDSDFGRTQRQRNVMEALYKKFQYADTDTLMKLFQEVLPYLSTNMTNGQIMRLAAKCIPAFGSIELHSYCVPANDSFYYASIREMSVLVPDLDKIRGQLENEYLPLN